MRRFQLFVAFSIFFPLPLIAQMLQGNLLNTLTNECGILRLEHGEDREFAFRSMLSNGYVSPNDLEQALISVSETLASSSDQFDVSASLFAIWGLTYCGTDNALQFLEKTMSGTSEAHALYGMRATMDLAMRNPAAFSVLSRVLQNSQSNNRIFHQRLYQYADTQLQYGELSGKQKDELVLFLLDATKFEVHEPERLDSLLCAADPSYANSLGRIQFASRIVNNEQSLQQTKDYFSSILTLIRNAGRSVNNNEEKP